MLRLPKPRIPDRRTSAGLQDRPVSGCRTKGATSVRTVGRADEAWRRCSRAAISVWRTCSAPCGSRNAGTAASAAVFNTSDLNSNASFEQAKELKQADYFIFHGYSWHLITNAGSEFKLLRASLECRHLLSRMPSPALVTSHDQSLVIQIDCQCIFSSWQSFGPDRRLL
jgi:hypothetical protein